MVTAMLKMYLSTDFTLEPSADWGFHLKGKLADNRVQYAVSVINGNGYKNPSRSKSMDIEGRISATPIKNSYPGSRIL